MLIDNMQSNLAEQRRVAVHELARQPSRAIATHEPILSRAGWLELSRCHLTGSPQLNASTPESWLNMTLTSGSVTRT